MKFLDPLILRHVGGKKQFLLEREIRCVADDGTAFTLPAGSSTNGFSFPRPVRMFLDPWRDELLAAVMHDVTYELQMFPQIVCDDYFLEAELSLGMDEDLARFIYSAVRDWGQKAYDDGSNN